MYIDTTQSLLSAPRLCPQGLNTNSISLIKSAFLAVLFSGSIYAPAALAASNYENLPADYQPTHILVSGERSPNYCSADIEAATHHPDKPTALQYNIDCMMTELKPYQAPSNDSLTQYYAYKAQAWLNYAYHENSEGSMTTAGKYALAEGLSILQALRDNNTAALLTTSDIPPSSAMMRPDLWASLMALKANGAIKTSPRELAFSEVKLIWAAAEYCEFGWRHAREHFNASERWINQSLQAYLNTASADAALQLKQDTQKLLTLYEPLDANNNQCHGQAIPNLPTLIALPIPEAHVSYDTTPPAPKVVHLAPYLVHFALDSASLSAESKVVLDKLTDDLAQLPDALNKNDLKLELFGYTDKRASQSYNLALSRRRTQAVAEYLISQGVPAAQITQYPEGKQTLLTQGEEKIDHALNRRVEIVLSFDDAPKNIKIVTAPTTKSDTLSERRLSTDLQLEK